MVARTQPERGMFVAFHRDGGKLECMYAIDGERAVLLGVMLLEEHGPLQPGDSLLVLDAKSSCGSDLPEPSRSSHYSG